MKSCKKWLCGRYGNPCKDSTEVGIITIFNNTTNNTADEIEQENNILNALRLGLESFRTIPPSIKHDDDDVMQVTTTSDTTSDSELNKQILNTNEVNNIIIELSEKENVKFIDDTIATTINALNYQQSNIDYFIDKLNEYDLIGVSADDALIINEMRFQNLQLKQKQQQEQQQQQHQPQQPTTCNKSLIVRSVESTINDDSLINSNNCSTCSNNNSHHDESTTTVNIENNKKCNKKKKFLNIWNYRIVSLSLKKSPTINHRYEQIVITNDSNEPKIQKTTTYQSYHHKFDQNQRNCVNVPSNHNCCSISTNFSINKQSDFLSNDSMEKSSTIINVPSSLSTTAKETTDECSKSTTTNFTNLINESTKHKSCFYNTKIKFIYVTPEEFFHHDPNDEIIRLQQEQKQLLKNDWCIIDYFDYDICKHANFIDDTPHPHHHFEDETIRCGNQATTSFNHASDDNIDEIIDDSSYVKVKRPPSVISLTSYGANDEHGIFYDPISFDDDNQLKISEAFQYCGQCLVNIKLGIKTDDNKQKIKKCPSSNTSQCEQEQLLLNDDNLINCSTENIITKFGLDDHGSIIINFDHIIEKKSDSHWLRNSKYKYTNTEWGKVINDDLFVKNYDDNYCCCLFRNFFNYLNLLLFDCSDNDDSMATYSRSGPIDLITNYVLLLGNDHNTTFSRNIQNFIESTKSSSEQMPQNVMKNVRQFICGMKNYLLKYGEGDLQIKIFHAQSLSLKLTNEFLDLDEILESVMHKLIVLPLKEHIYQLWVNYFRQKGDLELLMENINYASVLTPIEMGIRSTVKPPTLQSMCQISLLLLRLQEEQLPLMKLKYLLAVVSAIYDSTTTDNDHVLSADDLLPLLVYIITKCGFIEAEIEIEFMWCLLQQNQLNGEAGYYLTALASAVHVIKGFMKSNSLMAVSSVKNYGELNEPSSTLLRIRIPNEIDPNQQTCTVLLVQPKMTTEEVCKMLAQKVYIENPKEYGLFKIINGEETILFNTDYPLEMVQTNTGQCTLVFKRILKKIVHAEIID